MSNLSRKRAYSEFSTSRAETPEEEPEKLICDKDIIERLNVLDSDTRRKLLITAAQSHLDVLRAVKAKSNPVYETARNSTLSFQPASDAIHDLIYCYDDPLPKAFKADRADRVISEILRHLKTIDRESPQYASYTTRKNALVTLGDICRDIVDANTPVGKEVITHFQEDSILDGIMTGIVEGMTTEEIDSFKSGAKGKNWLHETKKLARKANDLDIFDHLPWLVRLIGGFDSSWADEVWKMEVSKIRARQRRHLDTARGKECLEKAMSRPKRARLLSTDREEPVRKSRGRSVGASRDRADGEGRVEVRP